MHGYFVYTCAVCRRLLTASHNVSEETHIHNMTNWALQDPCCQSVVC